MGFYKPEIEDHKPPVAQPEDNLTALLRRIIREEVRAALTDYGRVGVTVGDKAGPSVGSIQRKALEEAMKLK